MTTWTDHGTGEDGPTQKKQSLREMLCFLCGDNRQSRYCNKCGFHGPPGIHGIHNRPGAEEKCNYSC